MNGDTIRRLGLALFGAAAVLLVLAGCGSTDSGTARPAESAAAAGARGAEPEVIDCSFNKPAVRPAHLILACADLGAQVDRIVWQSWGPDQAQGDGIERDNLCDPNCAAGKYATRNVHITLSDLVRPGNVFTKATTADAEGRTTTWPMTPR